MAFKIKSEPTFTVAIKLVGQGREQTLNVTFRSKTHAEQLALIEEIKAREGTDADYLMALMESWDADLPLSPESLQLLGEHQPGALGAIITAYGEARQVARQKN